MRRRSELAAGLLLVFAVIFGRAVHMPQDDASGNLVYRDPEALQDLIKEEHASYTLIDVRTEEEYREGYIPTAVNIPVGAIEDDPPDVSRDELIVLYCRTGNRSANAQRILLDQGFTQVVDFGGIYRWPYELKNGQ